MIETSRCERFCLNCIAAAVFDHAISVHSKREQRKSNLQRSRINLFLWGSCGGFSTTSKIHLFMVQLICGMMKAFPSKKIRSCKVAQVYNGFSDAFSLFECGLLHPRTTESHSHVCLNAPKRDFITLFLLTIIDLITNNKWRRKFYLFTGDVELFDFRFILLKIWI